MSRPRSQDLRVLITRYWIPEVLALIAALLSLVALVILLAVFDKKPIFYWYGITLNTLVSILATLSKATLMLAVAESISQWKWILFSHGRRPLIDFESIDSASRGPFGSVKLLWKCKRATLIRLGAFTTVVAIAIEAFTQQLIQYGQHLSYSPDAQTTIARAQSFSKGNEFNTKTPLDPVKAQDLDIPNTYADADFSVQSAVLDGLVQPYDAIVQQLHYTCASSNCAWPVFESLAVCSVCNDLTSEVERKNSLGDLYAYLEADNSTIVEGNGTAFQLPNGLFIDNLNGWIYGDGEESDTIPGAVLMTTFGTGNVTETISLQDLDTLIWAMSILKVLPDVDNASAVWPNLPVQALECGLFYCVRSYNSTVVDGTLTEVETLVPNATRSPDSWLPLNGSQMAEGLNTSMLDSLEFNPAFSIVSRSDLVLGNGFNISQVGVDTISSFFQSQFKTRDIVFNSTEDIDGKMNGFYMNDSNIQYWPSAVQGFFSSPDINVTFQTIARSMSNTFRSQSLGDIMQTGEIGNLVIRYDIVWPWITLHCFVVVSGSIFLFITMRKSGTINTPVWKSSSLATLCCGPYVAGLLAGADTVSALQKGAATEPVQLFGHEEMPEYGSTTALAAAGSNIGDIPTKYSSSSSRVEEISHSDVSSMRLGPRRDMPTYDWNMKPSEIPGSMSREFPSAQTKLFADDGSNSEEIVSPKR